jgi:hypothetical protein
MPNGSNEHQAAVARLKMNSGFRLAVIQITNEIVSDRHTLAIEPTKEAEGYSSNARG